MAIVRDGESAHIVEINVSREWRGRGIGSELLRIIKEDFRGKRVTAEVFRERVGWYERNGFERAGERGHLVLMELQKS